MDDSIKNAMKYMSEKLKENPSCDKNKIIEEASREYDLSPLQTEFLINKYILEQ